MKHTCYAQQTFSVHFTVLDVIKLNEILSAFPKFRIHYHSSGSGLENREYGRGDPLR
jgi:hypothetical protein